MLQKEFETRINREVSSEFYFNVVEPMYMAHSGEKDEFCQSFVESFGKLSEERIAQITSLTTDGLKKEVDKLQGLIASDNDVIDAMVRDISISAFEGNESARMAIVRAKGWKFYLLNKVKKGYTLDENEVQELSSLIEQCKD